MSEYNPPIFTVSSNGAGQRSPNAFEHQAVHPIVYNWSVNMAVAGLGSAFVNFSSLGTFSVWEFCLYPVLDISLNSDQLGDLILQTELGGTFIVGPITEERRWAVNVGLNLINYRPAARYGRFQLVNRGVSVLNGNLTVSVRSL